MSFGDFFQGMAAAFAGGAAASGWTVSVIFAKLTFDGLDYNRADRMLRRTLLVGSNFQAVLMGIAAACGMLGGAIVTMVSSMLLALGFMSNVWTLAPRKGPRVTGVRENKKQKRIVAVWLTMAMSAMAFTIALLASFGI